MRADVQQSTGSEGTRKVFQGSFNMHVVAVNPNMKQLQEMGIKTEEEPDYKIYDKDDTKKQIGYQIRVFLENKFKEDTVKASVTFYMRMSFMESTKDPKNPTWNYIDERGNSMFLSEAVVASGQIPYNWLHAKSLKKAVMGEPELIQFIRNLTNAEQEGATFLENADIKKLWTGDIAGIRSVIKSAQDMGNAVRVLLLPRVKDGKVTQYVYDRAFDRAWSNTSKYMHKSLMRNRERLPQGVLVPFSDSVVESEFFIREVDPAEAVARFEAPIGTTAPHAATQMSAADLGIPGMSSGGSEVNLAPQDEPDDLPF